MSCLLHDYCHLCGDSTEQSPALGREHRAVTPELAGRGWQMFPQHLPSPGQPVKITPSARVFAEKTGII